MRATKVNHSEFLSQIIDHDRTVTGGMFFNPGAVMNSKGRTGDDVELFFSCSGNCQIRLNPSSAVEELGVNDFSNRFVNIGNGEVLQ